MSEVRGFLLGERDYVNLKGATGPLVYPAGFVYLYSVLYKLTNEGKDIALAQYMFLVLYLAFIAVVFAIYSKTKTPSYVLLFLCLSKRIHSIFVLRLFNDCFAMFFCYTAIYCFIKNHWNLGSLLFTIAVSVKMNVLLFAPGLLYLYLLKFGIAGTIPKLAICGLFQVLVGLPFLMHSYTSYLQRSFELGRQFMFKWTVNWRFIGQDIFLSKGFAIGLLAVHLLLLALFAYKKWFNNTIKEKKQKLLSPDYIFLVLSSSNLIGIICARSLHYQFYVWYFHTLPFLLWKTHLPIMMRVLILLAIEVCWNVYPSTMWSSLLLLISHLITLIAVYFADFQFKLKNW
jgi:alpha-1,3-mannosyltransferase